MKPKEVMEQKDAAMKLLKELLDTILYKDPSRAAHSRCYGLALDLAKIFRDLVEQDLLERKP